jgi:trans-aconitate methyltransferase
MSHAEDGAKNEWSTTQHALAYLNVADNLPHRTEGEYVLLDHVTKDTKGILDLGTGDGRLIKLLKADRPHVKAVAIDASPTMLKSARGHFANDPSVKILLVAVIEYEVHHNLVVIHRLWEWK